MRTRDKFVSAALCLTLAISLAAAFFPNFTTAQIRFGAEPPETKTWPIRKSGAAIGFYTIHVPVELGWWRPRIFSLMGDDSIHSIHVNGVALPSEQFPIHHQPRHPTLVNFGNRLHPGKNTLSFVIENTGSDMGLRIALHPFEPLIWIWTILLLMAGAMLVWAFLDFHPKTFGGTFAWILFAGIAIRILYIVGTPYYLRCYDLGGHVEYIKYVATHGSIPPANLAWETHQPPLYYLITGFWMRLTGQGSTSWLYGQWQYFSLLLAVGSMFHAANIARHLFPEETGAKKRAIFLMLIAFFPALIFQASRISNDVLFAYLSFAWFDLQLRWWNAPGNKRLWAYLSAVLGITFVTKNGALVLAAVTASAFVLRGCIGKASFTEVWNFQRQNLWTSMRSMLVLGLGVLVFAGWYQIPRALNAKDPSSFMVGKFHLLDEGLRIPAKPLDLVTFNPIEVIRIPFNSTWVDQYRRQYLPEFYFKSALFGEWPWGDFLLPSGRTLILCGLVLLALMFYGLWRSVRDPQRYLLVWLLGAGVLGAQLMYVIKEPFACNEDFRYFVIVTVPFAAMVAATENARIDLATWTAFSFCLFSGTFLGLVILL